MKRFVTRRLVTLLCATGMLGISSQVMAAAFQLWEQDGASIGNYHAGYAAIAEDASTAFYNPAGITRFKNQQLALGAAIIPTDFKFVGTVASSSLLDFSTGTFNTPMPVNAQGGTFSVVPNIHYVAPITDRLGFGFSVVAPFGLKTNYGISTPLRYASTMTSVKVIDVSPSLAFQVTDQASVGVGFDIQRMFAEFDLVGALVTPQNNATSINKANDTAYGYHLGAIYEFTPTTRAGISYHSQVVHHLSGSSTLEGPLVSNLTDGTANIVRSSRATANITLPPYTALSLFTQPYSQWAFMGSVIYTQWNTFQNLTLRNATGVVTVPLVIDDTVVPIPTLSTNIVANIPEHYSNSWNFAFGTNYYPTDRIILRGGLGYDQTPVSNTYRNTQLPDNDRYVVAFGGHYQMTKYLGGDLGYMHLFFNQARVAPPPQAIGSSVVTTNGHVTGGADVFSAQLTWDIV